MSFVLCALPHDHAPEPHTDTGVIMKGNNDMKRCLARVEGSQKTQAGSAMLPPYLKAEHTLLVHGWLQDAMLPCFRVKKKKHSAIFPLFI